MKPMVIVTATKRYGGLDLMYDGLINQTNKDFLWLLVDDYFDERHEEVYNKIGLTLEYEHMPPKEKAKTTKYGECNAINTGFIKAVDYGAELVIVLHDYIWLEPDAIDRFWNYYLKNKKALISGMKHFTNPPRTYDISGKWTLFSEPWTGKPPLDGEDSRMIHVTNSNLEELRNPINWEFDLSSIPIDCLLELNGIDESYDNGRVYDNQNISWRANMLDYMTISTPKIRGYEFMHWHIFGTLDKGSILHEDSNMRYHIDTMNKIKRGEYPLRAPNSFDLKKIYEEVVM